MLFCVLLYKDMHRGYDEPTEDQQSNIQNRIGSFFFIAINLFVGSIMNSSIKLSLEASVVFKEISSGLYGPMYYFWSKSILDMLVILPVTFLVSIGYYFLLDMRNDLAMFKQFIEFALWSTLISNSIGLFLGCMIRTMKAVIQVIPLVFVTFVILAGFIVNTSSLGLLSFMKYISPLKYMLEVIYMYEFDDSVVAKMII